MAHFWIRDNAGEWTTAPLDDGPNVMSPDGLGVKLSTVAEVRTGFSDDTSANAVVVRRHRSAGDTWVLVAPSGTAVRINGWPLHLGLRVLRDRDELRIGDAEPCFFSTERLAHVETMAETASAACCPRCRQPIAGGSPVVRCPRCGVFHHQTDELPCWGGYQGEPFATCGNCDHPVAAEAEFQWTPANL